MRRLFNGTSALVALLFAAVAAFAIRRLDDPDTWWHLAGGRYIATHGAVPMHDVFSYTAATRPWTDLQWLFDLALFGVYQLGGVAALILATAVLALLTFAILLLVTRHCGWVPATVALTLALLASQDRFVPRPEMLSFVLVAGYLALLEAYPGNRNWIWLILPLQVLWVNVHGVFVVGLILVGSYASGRTLATLLRRGTDRASAHGALARGALARLWAVAGGAGVLCLANPYGVGGALFPFTLLTRISTEKGLYDNIGEFQPPFQGTMTPVLWCYVLLMAIPAASFLLRWRVLRLDRLLAWGAFLALSLMARRNMGFFALVAAPPAADALAAVGGWIVARRRWGAWARSGRAVVAAALGLALAGLIFVVVTNRLFWWMEESRQFGLGMSLIDAPIGAADFVERHDITGRMFNDLQSGGYLIWRGAPARPVFIDGRLEVYDEGFFARYRRALSVPASFDSLAEEYAFDYIILFHAWENRWPLISYLTNSEDWALAYVDATGVVFIRNRVENTPLARMVAPELARQLGHDGAAAPAQAAPRSAAPRSTAPRGIASSWWQALVWPLQAAQGHQQKGTILCVLGQYAAAVREFEAALRARPDFSAAWFRLGYARWALGDHNAARAEWRRALELDPGNEAARAALQQAGAD